MRISWTIVALITTPVTILVYSRLLRGAVNTLRYLAPAGLCIGTSLLVVLQGAASVIAIWFISASLSTVQLMMRKPSHNLPNGVGSAIRQVFKAP